MKVLVLAGGSDQCALICELQQRGHEVLLVDYLENPPAAKLVEKHYRESTLDVVKVKEIAEKEQVGLVCTACTDQALLTVAKVSEELHLPCYLTYQQALNVTNKMFMKSKMLENGIPTSKYVEISNLKDVDCIDGLSYPLVVKPADCNSSKGVIKVKDNTELLEHLSNALLLSRTSKAIVEEFKEGIEVSADFYIEDGIIKLLSSTRSLKIPGTNGFTIIGSHYPVLNEEDKKVVIEIASKIAAAFELNNCPLLIQLIKQGDEYFVIEFSARMGGGSKYKVIETISGVDIMSKYVDLILGLEPHVEPEDKVKYLRIKYFYSKNGVITRYDIPQELSDNGIVDTYFLYKSIGDSIEKHSTSGDRPLGVLFTADNEIELYEKEKDIDSSIAVIDENGVDILIHGLYD